MELEGRPCCSEKYDIPTQKFMAETNGLHPNECGYYYMKPFRKDYVFGKNQIAVDAYISYQKLTLLIGLFQIGVVFVMLAIGTVFFCANITIIWLALSFAVILIFTNSAFNKIICKYNHYYALYHGNTKLIKK